MRDIEISCVRMSVLEIERCRVFVLIALLEFFVRCSTFTVQVVNQVPAVDDKSGDKLLRIYTIYDSFLVSVCCTCGV